MKNITNPLLTLAVGLGLFALTASQVQATGTGEFSVKLTRYQQGDSSTDGNNRKYTIDKSKFTTKDLLAFIQDNSSPAVNIPDGAYLEVDENGHFTVLDKNGDEVVVANLHHLIYLGYGDGVWSGKFNTETHQQKDKGNFLVYFGVESLDEKDYIDTQGLGKESYSRGDTTKSSWKESTSITAPVAGDGDFNNEFTTVDGKVTIKGNEKLTDI